MNDDWFGPSWNRRFQELFQRSRCFDSGKQLSVSKDPSGFDSSNELPAPTPGACGMRDRTRGERARAEGAGAPSVVLMQIPAYVRYPPIAESASVSGKVDVRVGERPDGSVAEVTVFPQTDAPWKLLLYATEVDAAARASFECRGCTQPSTPHTLEQASKQASERAYVIPKM